MWRHHMHGRNPFLIALLVVLGLAAGAGFVLLIMYLFENLWNYLLTPIFGIKSIGFEQAAAFVLFIPIVGGLFSAFRNRGHHGHRNNHSQFNRMKWRARFATGRNHWAGDEWNIHGGWKNWRYFDEWWKNEGKNAYEEYVDKNPGKEETNSQDQQNS